MAKITAAQRKDWRNLPVTNWNVLTFTEYFRDKNRELYGVEYTPLRNWRFEQGVLRRFLDEYGPEILREAFDECFRTYRPTAQYPILTAGFACAYRINGIIPRLLRERAELERRDHEIKSGPSVSAAELKALW